MVQAGTQYHGVGAAHRPTNKQVRQQLAVPCIEALLVSEQLRCAARLSTHGLDAIFALAQSAGARAWKQGLIAALEVFRALLLDKLSSLPVPHEDPRAWEQFWRAWPSQWHQLQGIFLQRAVEREDEFYQLCRSAGVALTSQAAGQEGADVPCPF